MSDLQLRAAFIELTQLFEQMIHLQGNFQHHAIVKPALEKMRATLSAPPPSPELELAQKVLAEAQAKVAELAGVAGSPATGLQPAAAIAAQYGVAGHPGCGGCKRTPEELIAGGHASGCSSLASASP